MLHYFSIVLLCLISLLKCFHIYNACFKRTVYKNMKLKFNKVNKYTLTPRSNKKEKNYNEPLPTVSKESQVKVQSVTRDELNSKLTENFC